MKVALLELDIAWKNPAENLRRTEALMAAAGEADLYVLPEMFATGFMFDKEQMADEESHPALLWMRKKAQQEDCAVAGSLAVGIAGKCYNRFYFVHPDGKVESYDKRHLFTMAGEGRTYEAGQRRVVVEFRGWRFLLQVCYDLRFPVWSRNKADYDAILYVANWPQQRQDAWETLLKARAIENQCYVIGVNRVGTDKSCLYVGGSRCVNPDGEVSLCQAGGSLRAELSKEPLEMLRRKFPVLDDADKFTLLLQ